MSCQLLSLVFLKLQGAQSGFAGCCGCHGLGAFVCRGPESSYQAMSSPELAHELHSLQILDDVTCGIFTPFSAYLYILISILAFVTLTSPAAFLL